MDKNLLMKQIKCTNNEADLFIMQDCFKQFNNIFKFIDKLKLNKEYKENLIKKTNELYQKILSNTIITNFLKSGEKKKITVSNILLQNSELQEVSKV